MPYIRPPERDVIGPLDYRQVPITTVGQLNFVITKLCHHYIEGHGLRYASVNAAIGVLECAKQELYRMVAVPYEDKKRKENGPISELDDVK